jgi:hypothetical protein
MVSVGVTAGGLGCHAVCYRNRGLGWMARLGHVVHTDNRFMTIVALAMPRGTASTRPSARSTYRHH